MSSHKIAVINTGGKQYTVSEGATIRVEKIEGNEGEIVRFPTYLVADNSADVVDIGKPALGTTVEGKIKKHFRGDKISVVKFKSKVRYRRNRGHRQHYTEIEIIKV